MSQQRTLGRRVKDPEDVMDVGIDWDAQGFLANRSTTITSSEWTVPTGLTADADGNTTTKTVVRLSGGTAGDNHVITNHVVLADGEEFDRSIAILIRSR